MFYCHLGIKQVKFGEIVSTNIRWKYNMTSFYNIFDNNINRPYCWSEMPGQERQIHAKLAVSPPLFVCITRSAKTVPSKYSRESINLPSRKHTYIILTPLNPTGIYKGIQ